MNLFYKCYSLLLSYPGDDFVEIIAEIDSNLKEQLTGKSSPFAAAKHQDLSELRDLIGQFRQQIPPTCATNQLQTTYVQLFDMTPDLSLHLTHHVLGSDKNRGPALIDLSLFYQEHGFDLIKEQVNELPDYFPLMLEFAAQQNSTDAKAFFVQWEKVIVQLENNLQQIAENFPEAQVYANLISEIRRFSIGKKSIFPFNSVNTDLEQQLSQMASAEAVKFALHADSITSAINQAHSTTNFSNDFSAMLNDDSEDERGSELAINWQQPDLASLSAGNSQKVHFYPTSRLAAK